MTATPEPGPWQVAADFDEAARAPDGSGPTAEVVDALAAGMDDEILDALLGSLESLADDDEPAARHYADHLVRLADVLPDVGRRMLLAGIDVVLAEMCASTGQWTEVESRVKRSRADVEELLPGVAADCEWMLGGAANANRHSTAACEHWTRARSLFLVDERWGEAGLATAGLAELATEGGHQGEELWREAAQLFETAEAPDEARECAEAACAIVLRRIRAMKPGEEAAALELATSARTLALRHGAAEPAAELACMAGLMSSDASLAWDAIGDWFTTARREFRSLVDVDPRAIRVNLAWVDCSEAFAGISRDRFPQAERLLTAALEVYREEDMTEAVELCEMQLAAILVFTEPDGTRPERIADAQNWNDADASLTAATIKSLNMLRQGRLDEATTALGDAREMAVAADLPHKAMALRAYAAAAALAQGDPGPVEQWVVDVDRFLIDSDASLPRTAVGLLSYMALTLRATLAVAAGDHDAGLTHLEQLESMLMSRGSGLIAAQVALQRSRTLLAAGRPRDAVGVALPAVLALDAVRFVLPDAERRSRWSPIVQAGLDTALRAAVACKDARLIAELIEVARGNAIPLPREGGGDAVAALSGLLGEPDRFDESALRAGRTSVLSGSDAVAGGEASTVLGLPAHIRSPWDTVALAEHLERARRYHDPVRADVTADWTVWIDRM